MARVSAVFPLSTELHEAVKGSAKQQVSAFVALKAWRVGKGSSNPKRLPWTPRWNMKSEGIQILCSHKKSNSLKHRYMI